MKSTARIVNMAEASGGRNDLGRRPRALLATLALAICALALSAAPAFAEPPTVVMGAVSGTSYGSTHVTGEIDTGGFAAEYFFEVSTNDVDWSSAHVEGELSEAPGLQSVEGTIKGLKGGTKYFVRLGAYNFDFSNFVIVYSPGPDPEFTTLPVDPPSVLSIEDAADVQYTVADVKGKVERPGGNADPAFDVECNFEYVSDDQFNATGFEGATPVACEGESPIHTEGQADVKAKLTDLATGTTYHLRLHAENAGGTDSKVAADTFTTLSSPPAPTVSIDPVTTFADSTAHLTGKVNPNGTDPALNSAWHFECVPACGEPGGTVNAGPEEAVSADISGLEPNTSYEVKLIASNAGGPDEANTAFKTDYQAPLTQTLFASEIEATGATVTAKINPHNSATTYQFEYGTDESYGSLAPVPAASLGQVDNIRHDVSQVLADLQPDTTYHFRVSVTNTESTVTTHGEDHTFRTGPGAACANEQLRAENNSLNLPDCRAYELVSSVKKNGNDAGAHSSGTGNLDVHYSFATADGSSLLYGTSGPQGIVHRGLQFHAIGHRSAAGWSSESAIPSGSSERIFATTYVPSALLPSTDLSKIAFASSASYVPDNPSTGGTAGSSGLYISQADGTIDWLSRPQTPNPEPPPGSILQVGNFAPVGASPDLGTVYFWALPTLLPGDAARAESGLGGWGLYEYSDGVLKSAGTLPPTAEHPNGTESPGGAAPAASVGDGVRPGFNLTSPDFTGNQVSRDGSTLFFVSPDPGPAGARQMTELYVRRNGHSTLVSHRPDGSAAPNGAAAVLTRSSTQANNFPSMYVYGSPDGKTAIFWSADVLAPGAPNDSTQKAYRYNVETDTVTYLPGVGDSTVLAASDDGGRFLFGDRERVAIWNEGVITTVASFPGTGSNLVPARATRSGSVFLFVTNAAIPGFNSGGYDQVYRYNVGQDQLSCLSCPPDNVTPSARAHLSHVPQAPQGEVIPTRAMSSDAGRVFFDSPDKLVPEDTNGVRDVYEWTPGGLSLISSGKSTKESVLLDNSADGNDVFFATTEGLDPRDTDDVYDVYDARVDGGFPQAAAVSPCSEDNTCKNAGTVPPYSPGPATDTFSSPGNPGPCPKGKVRKHGNCVKQQKPRKHKRHKQAHKKNKRTAAHGRGGSK